MGALEKSQLDLASPGEVSLFEEEETTSLLELLIILAKHKVFIAYVVGAFAITAVIVSLFLPVYYSAEIKIMPPQQNQSMASAMLDQLGSLGGVLGAAGAGPLGLKNPNDLYVAMLKSNTVADDLIDRFSLMSSYKEKLRVDARTHLASLSTISANKEGTISVAVEDRDPHRAAEMANAYIEELATLTKSLAVTDASKRRIFFEREVKGATAELEAAEQDFKKTQETTGIIQVDSQSKAILEAYEGVRAQLAAKEIEIESMRSFATTTNPELVRLQRERDALRAQMAGMEKGQGGSPVGDIPLEKVPEKALQYVDKLREVTYRNALLQVMLKQYEVARVDEAKDFALIQVLDSALPPEKKSRPHRLLICLFSTVGGFLIACIWVYIREAFSRAKEDAQYLTRLQLLKFYLSPGRHQGASPKG